MKNTLTKDAYKFRQHKFYRKLSQMLKSGSKFRIKQTGDGVEVLIGRGCGDSTGETCPTKPSAAAAGLRYRGNGAVRPTDG